MGRTISIMSVTAPYPTLIDPLDRPGPVPIHFCESATEVGCILCVQSNKCMTDRLKPLVTFRYWLVQGAKIGSKE